MGNTIQISAHRSDFGDVAWRLVNERDLSHFQINRIVATVQARKSEVPEGTTYRSGVIMEVDMDLGQAQQPAPEQPEAQPEPAPKAESIARTAVAPAAKPMVKATKAEPKAEPASDDKAERIEAARKHIEANPGSDARSVAKALGLTGSFAVQQATAALTALVKRAIATKESKDGATTYTLVGAPAKKAKKGAK